MPLDVGILAPPRRVLHEAAGREVLAAASWPFAGAVAWSGGAREQRVALAGAWGVRAVAWSAGLPPVRALAPSLGSGELLVACDGGRLFAVRGAGAFAQGGAAHAAQSGGRAWDVLPVVPFERLDVRELPSAAAEGRGETEIACVAFVGSVGVGGAGVGGAGVGDGDGVGGGVSGLVAVGTPSGEVLASHAVAASGSARAAWRHPEGAAVTALAAVQAGSRALVVVTAPTSRRARTCLLEVGQSGGQLRLRQLALPAEVAAGRLEAQLWAGRMAGRGGTGKVNGNRAVLTVLRQRECVLEVYDAAELAASAVRAPTALERHRVPPSTRAAVLAGGLILALHGGAREADSTVSVAARVRVCAAGLRGERAAAEPPPPLVLQRVRLRGVSPGAVRGFVPLPPVDGGSDGLEPVQVRTAWSRAPKIASVNI